MKFNNVYIEREILKSFYTKNILDKINYGKIILCDKYTEVFNPKNQNFRIQKMNPNIILAKKRNKLIFKTPEDYTIGFEKNFYFSHMLNCVYDCSYCFLQGMFNSANYLVFVNYEDYFKEIEKIINKNTNNRICFFSGYDCDSLALDYLTNFITNFIDFFSRYQNAFLEIRTKSVNIKPLFKFKPSKNIIIAYSINPQSVIEKFEEKTPNFEKRLNALKKIQEKGWNIGLRFDPIFISKKNKNEYLIFLERIFSKLDCSLIHSVTIGKFRMPEVFLKKIIKIRPEDSYNFTNFIKNNIEEEMMMKHFYSNIEKYVNKNKIFYN